jgi:hypothetical protein
VDIDEDTGFFVSRRPLTDYDRLVQYLVVDADEGSSALGEVFPSPHL